MDDYRVLLIDDLDERLLADDQFTFAELVELGLQDSYDEDSWP